MKKTFKTIFLIILVIIIVGLSYFFIFNKKDINQENNLLNLEKDNDISQAEEEFNASGQAKAILDEKDMLSFRTEDLYGKWLAIDDNDSVVEFKENKKIDYYAEQFMAEENFEINNGRFLNVGVGENKLEYEILEADGENLKMIYLGRGNILEYVKIGE
jgi:uncharacterized protein YxeA